MVESPCIKVCVLDPQQVCTGCGRSSAEIALWPTADDDLRRTILERAAARRARAAPGAGSGDDL